MVQIEQVDSDQNVNSLRQQIVALEDELEETATELKAARDRLRSNAGALAGEKLPMAVEPAFQFKA